MSASPSSASSNDDAYFSATEYVSPVKQEGGGDDSPTLSESLNALNDAAHDAVDIVNFYANINPPEDSGSDDDSDDDTFTPNPWDNMKVVAEKLEDARSKIDQAWKDAKVAHEKERGRIGDEDENDELDNDADADEDNVLSTIDFTVPVNLDMEVTIDAGVKINEDVESDSASDEEETKDDVDDIPADDFRAMYMEMMTETFAEDLEEIHQQGEAVDVNILVECLQSGMNFLEDHEKNKQSFFDSLGYDGNGDETMKSNNEEGKTIHELRQHRLGYIGSD